MNDPVVDALRQVFVARVQVVLSKKFVSPRDPTSGLWPRVTLEAPGKKPRTFALTVYASGKKEMANPKELNNLEKEILILASGSSRTTLKKGTRKAALEHTYNRVATVIHQAINRVANAKNGALKERHNLAQRKARKTEFLRAFETFCKAHGRQLEYEDIRPSDLGNIWDTLRKEKVAAKIMES